MIKNSLLSIKKNMGKTLLLFVIMFIIANLVIAGFSIKSASSKSVDSIKSTLGNEVTLSVNFKNMMGNRQPGEAVNDVSNILTTDMADQLTDLEYVENYNYTISANVDTSLTAVENESNNQTENFRNDNDFMQNSSSFSLQANTTMKYLSDFTDENYTLIEGRLLTKEDNGTQNCVIETNLAIENDLSIGDTFTMISTADSSISLELTIVGIYEIQNTSMDMGRMISNPVNTIYTDLSVGQTMNNDKTAISSATYYLDDPENVDAFKELAESESDIDFETFSLDSNDQLFQSNSSSLENVSSFATLFLIVVIVAGSAILCLILALTIRNRYYEIGVFLSLGQTKLKIIGQQLLEIGLIATLAFVLSLGTGKLTSNIISGMLTTNDQEMIMDMKDMPDIDTNENQNNKGFGKGGKGFDFNNAFQSPEEELDVSLTGSTIIKLAGTTILICLVSTLIPTIYVLRLSPREILTRKEG